MRPNEVLKSKYSFKKCRMVEILHYLDVDVDDSALLSNKRFGRILFLYNIVMYKTRVRPFSILFRKFLNILSYLAK